MKTITTGTEITFTRTKDIFELIQNDTGFDVKPVKLSKSLSTEPYTFQELLDLYESGKITIEGFEETDAPLVKSILINYIHTTEIETLKGDITRITSEKEALEAEKQQLTTVNSELNTESSQLKTTNQELTAANEKLATENAKLGNSNTELDAENKDLTTKNEKLNTALAAMQEEDN